MTNESETPASPEPAHPIDPAPETWRTVWRVLATLAAGAVAIALLRPSRQPRGPSAVPAPEIEVVRIVAPRLLSIVPGSPLDKKLEAATVASESVTIPVLRVTASALARLAPGENPKDERWDFRSAELTTAYTEWVKSRAEVTFAERQLAKVRELTEAQIAAQERIVERLRKLVAGGTEAAKDLASAESDLRLAQLQGAKQVFEAEAAHKSALRTRTALERQLLQAGLEPDALARAGEGTVVVVAEVPESIVSLVRQGQACEAVFYGFPGLVFRGRTGTLGPTLVAERRTLRVPFEIMDPEHRLRPGMFAEVGLGTEPREALLAPSDGILHVGRFDYMLVADQPSTWRVVEVQVGEPHGDRTEVLGGLRAGERVLGRGAILLKPFVVRSLRNGST